MSIFNRPCRAPRPTLAPTCPPREGETPLVPGDSVTIAGPGFTRAARFRGPAGLYRIGQRVRVQLGQRGFSTPFRGLAALVLAVVLSGIVAGRALAYAAAQPEGDVTTWPLIVAVFALVAMPIVASGITALLLRLSGTGIPPETVVWLVSAALVAVGYFTSGGALPLIDPTDPGGTIAGWLVLAVSLEKLTRVVYDLLLVKVWGPPTA